MAKPGRSSLTRRSRSASFTYQSPNFNSPFGSRQGAAFVLQSVAATSVGGSGEGLGYGGITPSLAVALQINSGSSSTTLFRGGTISGGAAATTPLDLRSGNPINVQIGYNGGSIVHESLTDTVTNVNYAVDYFLSPPLTTILGGSSMFVGITGGTDSGADQIVSNFQFTNVPEPSGLLMITSALPLLMRRRPHY